MNTIRTLTLTACLAFLLGTPLAGAHSTHAGVGLPAGFTPVPAGLLPTEPAPAVDDAQTAADDQGYSLRFTCPALVATGPVAPEPQCPVHIIDEEDIMSQPVLLSDPYDPTLFGFNAMHGARGLDQGPTNISRNNVLHQPHTTFYTSDNGQTDTWNDNPYYSPLQPPPNKQNLEDPLNYLGVQITGRQVFGVDNAATLDAQGRVYLASLYAFRDSYGSGPFDYAFGLWKSQYRVKTPVSYNEGNVIRKLPAGAVAETPHAVYVPGTDRVAVLWLEKNDTSPLKSYINLTWTVPGKGGVWYSVKPSQRVGPCSGISNPIAYGGLIYVGCFADTGFAYSNATLGALQIFSFDTRRDAWTSTWVSETTIARTSLSANAVLIDRTDGRMIVASAGLTNDRKPFLKVTTGEQGAFWDEARDYASGIKDIVRPTGGTVQIEDARVMAGSFVLRSGNLLLIYKERYQYADGADPDAPQFYKGLISVFTAGERGFNKVLPLVNPVDRARDPQQIDPKNSVSACQPFDARTKGPGQDAFNDFHDSIVVWQNREKHQRHFIAYGDCGNVRFAEVKEENFIAFAFPAPPGTPPIPLAAPGANPQLVGVAAGALAGAMVLRMLAFKRKVAVEAPA